MRPRLYGHGVIIINEKLPLFLKMLLDVADMVESIESDLVISISFLYKVSRCKCCIF